MTARCTRERRDIYKSNKSKKKESSEKESIERENLFDGIDQQGEARVAGF